MSAFRTWLVGLLIVQLVSCDEGARDEPIDTTETQDLADVEEVTLGQINGDPDTTFYGYLDDVRILNFPWER